MVGYFNFFFFELNLDMKIHFTENFTNMIPVSGSPFQSLFTPCNAEKIHFHLSSNIALLPQ